MKRKKLLYVGNALSTRGITITHIETLSQHLKQEGFEVVVTSSKKNKIVRMLDMISTFFRVRKSIDVILIDTYSTNNFLYAIIIGYLSRIYSKAYIPILHGGNLPLRLTSNPRLSKAFFNNALVNVAPSRYLSNAFAKAEISNIIVIPNSIEIANYDFKPRLNFEPKLLWVRSFAEIYNPMMAIHIFEELLKSYPAAALTMVGPDKDGSLEKCKSYVLKNNLPVTFTGKLSKAEWIAKSAKYDIFLNTTDFDNTPVSVIEAMALGLLVVSTNVGGMSYLIKDSVNGILLEPNDVDGFTREIKNLIQNPKQTYKITENARSKVESFDWGSIKDSWLKILN